VDDSSKQWNEFYLKKGRYLTELSENHYKNKEYKKALELLNQAYNMFKKGNTPELAEVTKQKFSEIKAKHFKKKEE
jgi:protein subunit release factor A